MVSFIEASKSLTAPGSKGLPLYFMVCTDLSTVTQAVRVRLTNARMIIFFITTPQEVIIIINASEG